MNRTEGYSLADQIKYLMDQALGQRDVSRSDDYEARAHWYGQYLAYETALRLVVGRLDVG